MSKFYVLVMIGLFTHFNFYSQTCCSGGIPLSNSIGLPIANKGALQFGLNYDYNYLNTLNSGSDELDDQARLRTTQSVLFSTGYSITNNFSFELLLTYVNQTRKITQFEDVNLDETNGIGDGVLLFKYNFNQLFKQNNTLRIGLGAKIPIGATDKKNDQGILLNADLQPGSGAWDMIFWTSYLHNFSFRPTATFSATAIYRLTGTNNDYLNNLTTYRFGPEFQTFINYVDEFFLFKTLINPGLSIKYRKAQQDEIGGILLDNTGGKWLIAIPSIGIQLSQKLTFLTKFEIPMYSYVEGTQLTPTYRVTAGLYLTIEKKNKEFFKLQ